MEKVQYLKPQRLVDVRVEPISKKLVQCLRVRESGAYLNELKRFSCEDWGMISFLATANRLAPMLFWDLKPFLGELSIPDSARETLRESLIGNAYRNILLHREIANVVKSFQESNVRVMLLKGAFLSAIVHEDVPLRIMGDVDLLVRPEDLGKCNDILLKSGYGPSRRKWIDGACRRLHHHVPAYTKRVSVPIEVHWNIVRPQSPFPVCVDDLWGNSKSFEYFGTPCESLTPEMLLVHLSIHACFSNLFKGQIYAIVDIVEMIKRHDMEWDKVVYWTRKWCAQRCTFPALLIAKDLFSTEMPQQILSDLGKRNKRN